MAKKHNIGMIVVMIIAIIIGFIAMGFTATAAGSVRDGQEKVDPDRKNSDLNNAHKDATVAAWLGGVISGLIFIALLLYVFRKEASVVARGALEGAQQWIGEQRFGD